jgi:hypothetical protein
VPLSRELRSRLLTLVVLAAAAFGLWVWAVREDVLHAPRPVTGALYPELATEQITWIYLRLVFGQELELQREPGAPWRITRPTTESARQDYVAKLLDDLARATVEPVEVGGETLRAADVGLEPPLHQISFGNARDRETLLLGSVEPLGRMVYARRSGDTEIVLATRNLVTLLQFNSADFVDPTLLRGLAGEPVHVRIERDGGVLIDAVREGGPWALTAPVAAVADDDRINQLVRGLFFARASGTVFTDPLPADLHAIGLPAPEDRARSDWRGATLIEVASASEAPVRAWLAAGWQQSPGDVAALREDGTKVVSVPAAAFAMLANKPSFFREHRLLPPLRDRAESLRLLRGDELLLDIRRARDGSWSFQAPERLSGQPVENERVEAHSALGDFLERIDTLEASAFTEPPAGVPVARIQLTWTRGGEARLETIDLHEPTPEGVPAVHGARPDEGLLLPASVMELFAPETPDLLRRLTPLAQQVDDERWTGFRVEYPPPAPPLQIARTADGGWTGDDAWGRIFGLGRDLQRGLRGFRWQRAREGAAWPWRMTFLDAAGAPLAEVRLRLPEPDEPPEANGYPCAFAALPGHEGVELVVSRAWVEQVQALLAPQQRGP